MTLAPNTFIGAAEITWDAARAEPTGLSGR